MRAPKPIIPAAPILLALAACAQIGQPDPERDQALTAFVTAQDEARDQLRLFQNEPHGSCGSQHLAQASSGAEANLALLDPSRRMDPSVVPAVAEIYGQRPVADAASLTLDVADEAAESGCPDQARSLYRSVIDRYVRSDYAGYRQRAEVGLAEIEGQ